MGWFRQTRHQIKETLKSQERRQRRLLLISASLLLLAVGVTVQLFRVQVIQSQDLRLKATQSRHQSVALFSRGRILDRNGVILAQDSILYDLYAHPSYYWDVKPDQIAQAISPILKQPIDKLSGILAQPYSTIRVQRNLTRPAVKRILNAKITMPLIDPKTQKRLIDDDGTPLTKKISVPGMDFSKKMVRSYPQGTLGSHILGYLNDEANISAGVEYSASQILKRKPVDFAQPMLDGQGRYIETDRYDPEMIANVPQSDDIHLTIDSRLQYFAEEELAAGIKRAKADRGSVVMMNPKTGEILAFALWPKYNPEKFYKVPTEILKNFALSDVYPPGSTFKILTVACGIDTGVINRNTRLLDTGRMKVGGWNIENYDYYKRPNPGMIDLVYLLQHSSNIGSAKIALMMDKKAYWDRLHRFGIGTKTGIDLPGESAGILLPTRQWDESTKASMGYGYGIASTPIQLASAVAAIANGGVWNQPYLIRNNHKPKSHRVISEASARTVTDLLAQSIEAQKQSSVQLKGIPVAGKTGTSRKPNPDGRGYSNMRFTSFVGYFPAKDPEVLMMVVVDSPRMGEAWGSTVAGPIFKGIADKTVAHLGIKPVTIAVKP